LDEFGKPTWFWCLSQEDRPAGDLNVAQKIALENFENSALARANGSSATAWRQIERQEAGSYRDWLRRLTSSH
jgi:hypothetical protein